jgi:hypothetical protein
LPIITNPNSDIELVFSVWANEGEGDCDKLGLETKLPETYVTTEISQFTGKYLSKLNLVVVKFTLSRSRRHVIVSIVFFPTMFSAP